MAPALPTMPSPKRQKFDRESRAAYITSQPLFDALRNATIALSDQKALLKSARDTVQGLHVKVVNGDSAQHELYMKNIVASWVGVTEMYHDIFRQLVLITAADPREGREAAGPHGHLVAIAETVREAKDLAQEVWTAKVDAESSEEEEEEEEEEEDDDNDDDVDDNAGEGKPEASAEKELASDSSSDSPPAVESSKPPLASLPTGLKKRPIVDDASAEEGVKQTQELCETVSKNKARRHRNAKASARRKAAKEADADTASIENGQPERAIKDPARPSPAAKVQEALAYAQPLVEYENVGAEVEARLKAKAERAAAKKVRQRETKRKRESVDSFAKIEVDDEPARPGAEPEPTAAKEEAVVKPKKKKSKKTHVRAESVIDGTATNTNGAPLKQERAIPKAKSVASVVDPGFEAKKRKPDVEITVAEGGGGKKRKTKHTGKG